MKRETGKYTTIGKLIIEIKGEKRDRKVYNYRKINNRDKG